LHIGVTRRLHSFLVRNGSEVAPKLWRYVRSLLMRRGFIIVDDPEYYDVNTEEEEEEEEKEKKNIRDSSGKHMDVVKAVFEDDKANA
jgi:hypothetical protein